MLRWLSLRVLAVTFVLAVPILGTSYALVSSVSTDIRMAATEHEELAAFARAIDLVPGLEALHRDLADGSHAAAGRDVARIDSDLSTAENTYEAAHAMPATHAVWQRWRTVWSAAARKPTIPGVDRALDALQEIGNELDDDSPLEFDPSFAVQNLVATTLRQTPRSIVAIRHTADSVDLSKSASLDAPEIERIATSRALQREPLDRLFSYMPEAVSIAPSLAPELNPAIARARAATGAFGARVDRILATIRRDRDDRRAIELLARHAIDTQIALWRSGRAAADGLVYARYQTQLSHRRIIVALALLAVLLGVSAITFVSRYLARGDRIALAAAQLESENLRRELQQISIERALRLQEAQFRSVFENADLGIVIFELSGAIAQNNGAVGAILGERTMAVLNDRQAQISTFATYSEPFTLEELHTREDGSVQWLALTFSGVYDDGACQMVILLLRDTTEEKLLHAGLMHAANHDGLTQIANRSAFEAQLETLISAVDEDFALMYIDLDKFKPINDRFGHAAGDHVLITVAERLRSALASNDFCARLGGDEFAALVRGRLERTTLASIAARISATVALPIAFDGLELTVTTSIGVAVRDSRYRTANELKIAADRALYAAKGCGGNAQRIDDTRDPRSSAAA